MSDDVLRRNLRVVDSPVRPNPVFVDDLHARLAAELGFEALPQPVEKVPVPTRPQFRRRGRLGWLAVAAILVLTLMALLLSQLGRTSVEPPPPPSVSPSTQPSVSPSTQPSAPPSSQAIEAPSPAVSFAPITDASPEPANLRSDGLIVYETDSNSGLNRLRVTQPDLSSVELLPDVTDVQFGAAWHPDGERIAYAGFDPAEVRSRVRIWETDARGTQPVLLSEGCESPSCIAEYEPSYSPDGTRLAFVRTRVPEGGEEESVVAIRDMESGAVTELEATSRPRRGAENLHPRWSPDGQTIAYGVSEYDAFGFPGGPSTIHLVDADGSNERTITAPELLAGEPEWSPDGTMILFASNPWRPKLRAFGGLDAPHRLGVMNADGSDARLIDLGRVLVAPSWTANGEQILFTLMEGQSSGDQRPFNPRLFVMDPDGSNILPLSQNPGDALYGVQQPAP